MDLKPLARALKKLKDGQGKIARRNARAAVKREAARILRRMDQQFPTIRRVNKTEAEMMKRVRKVVARTKRLRAKGFAPLAELTRKNLMLPSSNERQERLAILAELGIRIAREGRGGIGSVWVPGWTNLVPSGDENERRLLAKLKRDIPGRKALAAARALERGNDEHGEPPF